jgi:cytochrome c
MAMMKKTTLMMMTFGWAATASHAVLTWPNCKDVANGDFTQTILASHTADEVEEPMKMAFDLLAPKGEEAKGKVDVYFTERLGKVRKFDSKTGKVLTLATIPLDIDAGGSSDGVLGIALDPAFKTTHNLYVYYTFIGASEKSWRISRFTLNAGHTLMDLNTERVTVTVPIKGGSRHPGGALQFDSYGDLWITTGNDYKLGSDFPFYSSPNTNDLRGKILRIHPSEDGRSYTIPNGNLFPPNTPNTRPEIYIMGNRNPYTLSLDPVRRWAVWGDVGPDGKNVDGGTINAADGTDMTEEYNLAKGPGNSGYPFFAGTLATKPGADATGPVMPANYTWEGAQPGLTKLPAAFAPIYAYRKSCAITGPIYRYDGDLKSSVKFPPHFNRKWLVTDFSGDNNKVTAFTLNDEGTEIKAQEKVIGIPLHAPLDMQFGPDGALYVNNYDGYRTVGPNTGIVRIDYGGGCSPALPKLEGTTNIAKTGVTGANLGPRIEVNQVSGLSIAVGTEGAYTLEVLDLAGRPVASRQAHGPAPIALSEVREAGVYFLQVKSEAGLQVVKIIRR